MTLQKTKKRKKVSERGLSESNLQNKWRAVILKHFHNRCFFCGKLKGQVEIECHHIVKRNTLLLRHDWRNGLPVCKFGCHSYAETPTGKHLINEPIIKNNLLDYLQERSGQSKDYFVKKGITKTQFLKMTLEDLTYQLENDDYSDLPF
jgi:hypothetical protein